MPDRQGVRSPSRYPARTHGMSEVKKTSSRGSLKLNTLILVLGGLAAVSLVGFIGISLRSGHPSGDALLGICPAIVGYLGGLLTPTRRRDGSQACRGPGQWTRLGPRRGWPQDDG